MNDISMIIENTLSPELVSDMGECAYQRLIFALGFAVPVMEIGFAMGLCFLLLHAIYRLVVGKC